MTPPGRTHGRADQYIETIVSAAAVSSTADPLTALCEACGTLAARFSRCRVLYPRIGIQRTDAKQHEGGRLRARADRSEGGSLMAQVSHSSEMELVSELCR